MKKLLQNDVFIGIALALAAFGVYFTTLSPSIGTEDSGEIATSLYTLGIIHPTGYPLFTLMGWVFSHLPIGGRVIWRLNLMVAVFCSVSVFFFYRLFLFLLSEKARNIFPTRKSLSPVKGKPTSNKKNVPSAPDKADLQFDRLAAAVSALVLAFARIFWEQAVSLEVYSLHLVFLPVVIWLFLRALAKGSQPSGPRAAREWLGFAFVLGLSFTNHVTTVLLAPAFLYLFFSIWGFGRTAWIKIGQATIPFAAALTLYLYLPLRAAQSPPMNWGDPVTLQRFWWHVTGKLYDNLLFHTFEVTKSQFGFFLSSFPPGFGYIPLLLAVAGAIHLFRHSRRAFFFTSLLFLTCILWSINYDVHDVGVYFLQAYVAAAMWVACGVRALLSHAIGGFRRKVAVALCVALVCVSLGFNYGPMDESRDYALEDYARNVLKGVDSGAVIFSDNYENLDAPAFYLQRVEGFRTDVTIINAGLERTPWYCFQLAREHPWIVASAIPEMEALRASGRADEILMNNRASTSIFRDFMLEAYRKAPVYVTMEIQPSQFEGFQIYPDGLLLRLAMDSLKTPIYPKIFDYRPLIKSKPEVDGVKKYYAGAYTNQGIYRLGQGDVGTAEFFFEKALELQPDFPEALGYMAKIRARQQKPL